MRLKPRLPHRLPELHVPGTASLGGVPTKLYCQSVGDERADRRQDRTLARGRFGGLASGLPMLRGQLRGLSERVADGPIFSGPASSKGQIDYRCVQHHPTADSRTRIGEHRRCVRAPTSPAIAESIRAVSLGYRRRDGMRGRRLHGPHRRIHGQTTRSRVADKSRVPAWRASRSSRSRASGLPRASSSETRRRSSRLKTPQNQGWRNSLSMLSISKVC